MKREASPRDFHLRNDKGDLKGFQANFETICHNLTPVNQKASKEKKRMYTFEKTTELVWQGLSRQCFLQNQLMILRKVLLSSMID